MRDRADSLEVILLAAGRGDRMRPLTDDTPKPLLRAGGDSLIGHLLRALARAGLTRIVVNHAHLGRRIVAALGDGSSYGVRVRYSDESDGALETGGGIVKALAQVRDDVFAVVNGDIWTDFPFERLPRRIEGLAHLVLVDNPGHHPRGDFALRGSQVLPREDDAEPALTFSGIGVYRRALFEGLSVGCFPLGPILRAAARRGQVRGEHYRGGWTDVGTPERLAELDRKLRG
jgi:MurNAc alpha-1-phosphate uridylyltransferase